jgi:hypothetical protein
MRHIVWGGIIPVDDKGYEHSLERKPLKARRR